MESGSMTLAVSELSPDDDSAFMALARIYQDAIEPSEQKSVDELSRMRSDPRYVLLVASSEGAIVGFSIVFAPMHADLWLLEYMAVDKEVRSRGIGALLFAESARTAQARQPGGVGVIELDRPGTSPSPDDLKTKRLAFYGKAGCRALEPLDYILPIERSGVPPPMMLMLQGGRPGATFSREQVRKMLSVLYQEVYGVPLTDPRFVTMLSALPPTLAVVGASGV
jgi:GNAT superfamily N-acetyltransferase